MRKPLTVFILLVLGLSLLSLPVLAQEATAEPTPEATIATEAPTAEITAEGTAVVEPVPPTEAPAAENPAGEADAPTGLSTLVLLLGLAAVSVVGLAMVARDNLRSKPADKP